MQDLGAPTASEVPRCDLPLSEALPEGATVTSSRCDMGGDTLYFGGTYSIRGESSAFFLADDGGALKAIPESEACGTDSGGLPPRVRAYCEGGQPDDGGFPGAPLEGSPAEPGSDTTTSSTTPTGGGR